MRGKGARSGRGFRDVNVTPLVDVMLVLLIVFMITAPLLTTGLPVDLPNVSAEPSPLHDSRIVVTVTRDERVFLGDEEITANPGAALRRDPEVARLGALYVRADEGARYGAVARVVAAAGAAGVTTVNLVVEREVPGAASGPGEHGRH